MLLEEAQQGSGSRGLPRSTIYILEKDTELGGIQERRARRQCKESMWALGISLVMPCRTVHPRMLNIIGEVDIFRVLRFETMHNFHIGLTRLLQARTSEVLTSLSERLRSETLRTTEFLDSNGSSRSFRAMRTHILRSLNDSMELFEPTESGGWIPCFTSVIQEHRTLEWSFPFPGPYVDVGGARYGRFNPGFAISWGDDGQADR